MQSILSRPLKRFIIMAAFAVAALFLWTDGGKQPAFQQTRWVLGIEPPRQETIRQPDPIGFVNLDVRPELAQCVRGLRATQDPLDDPRHLECDCAADLVHYRVDIASPKFQSHLRAAWDAGSDYWQPEARYMYRVCGKHVWRYISSPLTRAPSRGGEGLARLHALRMESVVQ